MCGCSSLKVRQKRTWSYDRRDNSETVALSIRSKATGDRLALHRSDGILHPHGLPPERLPTTRSSTAEPSALASSEASQLAKTTTPLSEESVAPLTSVASGAPPPVSHSSRSYVAYSFEAAFAAVRPCKLLTRTPP